jgi:hypothetical protein
LIRKGVEGDQKVNLLQFEQIESSIKNALGKDHHKK